ncbi:helix-turn-helix domain-containing protein [Luteimonas weifangensis]|uniref:Helix-turn-helix domain-containing protein n=1 Tax=Cognatiluteimonas weifangensis TaxID=2303539 RepID=A0A372DPA6_9GAMM|nr:helix-turn-helix domain-containing protein [Luteimonas weifangensis]RFP61182.1 helix-turn-helix domain-containing protein [Luteimonas weifangensis]
MQANPTQSGNGVPEGDRGCGARLRKAREAAGLSQADVAARLKMPLRVVQSLEVEDWSRLGAPVFVRGQLRSYSRLLGLTTAPMFEASGVAPVEPPKLVPRTYTRPLQHFAEQAARRLVYVVMTIAIAIPVWLATRPHLGSVAHDAAPLDVPAFGDAGTRDAVDQARPLVASLAPLPAPAAPALSLRLRGDSWVEIVARDGRTLEQSLLRAGEQRSYDVDEVGRVVLGDANVVDVRSHGRPADLTPYLRANVARFTVSSDGSLAPAAD